MKRLSVCSVVKKHSLKLSEKSTGSRVAKVWGSIPGAQFAKRDATRPRLPSFFAPPRIYFSSSQVCGSLIIKSLCGKIYLPLPSFSLNRQKTVLDSCAHRNAPSTRNIQQKGKKKSLLKILNKLYKKSYNFCRLILVGSRELIDVTWELVYQMLLSMHLRKNRDFGSGFHNQIASFYPFSTIISALLWNLVFIKGKLILYLFAFV